MSVRATAPPVLLPEVLGFSPQFVLDSIINIANQSVEQSVEAIEKFLRRWADNRVEEKGGDWDGTHEVEQGLVAFQTLLESHVDIALDFFEVWCMRNIFVIPADLPIVVPHQRGLVLEHPPEQEQELLVEIEDLRRRIAVASQRKLNRMYKAAVRVAGVRETRSQKRLERMEFLRAPQVQTLRKMSKEYQAMYESMASLPAPDSESNLLPQTTEPGKRQWETGNSGYANWAVGQLLTKAGDGRNWGVEAVAEEAYSLGTARDVKALLDEEREATT